MILGWSSFTKGELPFDTQHRGDPAKPIDKFSSSGTKKPLNEGLFDFLKRNDSKKRVETDQPALLASLVKLDFLLEALLA